MIQVCRQHEARVQQRRFDDLTIYMYTWMPITFFVKPRWHIYVGLHQRTASLPNVVLTAQHTFYWAAMLCKAQDAAYCYRCSVVCVCLLDTTVSPAKTDEPIEMPFGLCTLVFSKN